MPCPNPARAHPLCAAIALALGSWLAVPVVQAAAVLPLAQLDGSSGFRLHGAAARDRSGVAVSAAGDVNGDGIDDLIIGAHDASPNGAYSGSSWVVFGRSGGSAPAIELSSLDGSSGFRLDGVSAYDFAGLVAGAGDLNGDGFDDLVIGAPNADPNGGYSGSSYVVFGRSGGFAPTMALSSLDGSSGFRLDGAAAYDTSGSAVAGAGDINGDGIDDLIIGANYADWNGTDSGSSYVVFGRSSGFAPAMALASLDGSNGFRLDGVAAGDRSGLAVSAAGDVNGDGVDDVVVGAHHAEPNGAYSGSSWVVFGATAGFAAVIDLSALDGSSGFRLDGAAAGDASGFSVSAAGDLNGDGVDDLVIGASSADPNGNLSGSSYVVFGRTDGFAPLINLSALDGSDGFRVDGALEGDTSGRPVAAAGDLNGDGVDDLLVSTPGADPNGTISGGSVVLFGRSDGFAPVVNLASLDGNTGVRIDGVAAFDQAGIAVSAAGDVNADGIDDVLIGAPSADPNGTNAAGSSYVVFGRAAPLLEAGASGLIEMLEDDIDGAGRSVASLALDVYLDVEPFAGVAIDYVLPSSSAGEWQYRTGANAGWFAVPNDLSSHNALVLAPDASLRFLPAKDFTGAVAPLDLRLWDGGDAVFHSYGRGNDILQSIGSLGGFSNDDHRLPVAAVVLPVNEAPSFDASDPPGVLEGAGMQTVTAWAGNFSAGPANESHQQMLGYSIGAASDPDQFSVQPFVAGDGSLSYTLAADANGSPTFSVQVQDDGGTANGGVDTSVQTFTIAVQAVNDAPAFDASDPPGVLEDAGAVSIAGWAGFDPGPDNESAQQALGYVVSDLSNAALFAVAPAVAADGSLGYTLADEVSGSASFSVVVQDDGGTTDGGVDTSTSQSFTITAQSVNDAPSFDASDPPRVLENSGTHTVDGWAGNFSSGPVNESDQELLDYVVGDISNPALFTVAPAVAVDGSLSYTLAAAVGGSSTFSVRVQDDGGSANGGVDISAPQTFTIYAQTAAIFCGGFEDAGCP